MFSKYKNVFGTSKYQNLDGPAQFRTLVCKWRRGRMTGIWWVATSWGLRCVRTLWWRRVHDIMIAGRWRVWCVASGAGRWRCVIKVVIEIIRPAMMKQISLHFFLQNIWKADQICCTVISYLDGVLGLVGSQALDLLGVIEPSCDGVAPPYGVLEPSYCGVCEPYIGVRLPSYNGVLLPLRSGVLSPHLDDAPGAVTRPSLSTQEQNSSNLSHHFVNKCNVIADYEFRK